MESGGGGAAKKPKRAERIPPHVGQQMRKWRTAAGMTQQKVADEIGCSKSSISQAETGVGNMSLPLFLDFCAAINTPSSKVLEERILAKHRDVDRLAAAIVEKVGIGILQELAALSKHDLQEIERRIEEGIVILQHERRSKAHKPKRRAN